jgi:hypothetical protein
LALPLEILLFELFFFACLLVVLLEIFWLLAVDSVDIVWRQMQKSITLSANFSRTYVIELVFVFLELIFLFSLFHDFGI